MNAPQTARSLVPNTYHLNFITRQVIGVVYLVLWLIAVIALSADLSADVPTFWLVTGVLVLFFGAVYCATSKHIECQIQKRIHAGELDTNGDPIVREPLTEGLTTFPPTGGNRPSLGTLLPPADSEPTPQAPVHIHYHLHLDNTHIQPGQIPALVSGWSQ
jgi:hypothetical protein